MHGHDLYLVTVPSHSTRRIVPRFLCLSCASSLAISAHAGIFGTSSAGTEEFPGLQIISAARPAGLAGAYGALAEGASSININPAGLAHETGRDYSGSVRLHPDAANAGDVAYSFPFGSEGRLGFSASYLNYGTIAGRDEHNVAIGDLNPSSFYPALTYASSKGDRWRWGASLKGALEDPGAFAGAQKALGAGADAGIQYRPAKNLGLGASVVNAGVKLRGHSRDEAAGSGLLPGAFRAGAFFHPQGLEKMSVALDAEVPFYEAEALSLGYEYRVLPEWELRAGTRWDYNDLRNFLGWIGANPSTERNGSALKAAVGTTVRTGPADVAYALQWWNDLGFVHALTVSWRVK